MRRLQNYLNKTEDIILVSALAILILLSFSQIIMRNFFSTGFFWGDAAARYLVLWVGLLGAMIATRDDHHISIDIVSKFTTRRVNLFVRLITDSATAFITGLLTYSSILFIKYEFSSGMKAFALIPTWIAEIIFPIAFATICIRYIAFFISHLYTLITDAPFNPAGETQEEQNKQNRELQKEQPAETLSEQGDQAQNEKEAGP